MSACETNIKNSLIAKATQFFKENNSEITVMPIDRIQEQENVKTKLNNEFINLFEVDNTESTLSNSNQIKQGVVELFESNPELANEIYKTVGINQESNATQRNDKLDKIKPDGKTRRDRKKIIALNRISNKSKEDVLKEAGYIEVDGIFIDPDADMEVIKKIPSEIWQIMKDNGIVVLSFTSEGNHHAMAGTITLNGVKYGEIQFTKNGLDFIEHNILHEIGHIVWQNLTDEQRQQLSSYKEGITPYVKSEERNQQSGASNVEENFAESFSIDMQERLYGKNHNKGYKNKYQIEEQYKQLFDNINKIAETKQITPQQKQQAQQLYGSYLQTTNNPTIEGFKQWNRRQQQVSELFDSNPELANEVYEALGFVPKMISREGQEYFNNPRIRFFVKIADEVRAVLPDVKEGYTRLYRGNRPSDLKSNPQFTNSLEGIALPFLMSYEGQLSYIDVPTPDLSKYVQRGGVATNAEFIVTSEIAKSATPIDNTIVEKYKEQYPDKLAPVEITPQQKQQAQQLYSEYLESLNKPNTNPILQGNQQEQVRKFSELQERLNNKEFLEGAKNAFESSKELQNIYYEADGFESDNKNIVTVFHGSNYPIKFENFDINKRTTFGIENSIRGIWFAKKELAEKFSNYINKVDYASNEQLIKLEEEYKKGIVANPFIYVGKNNPNNITKEFIDTYGLNGIVNMDINEELAYKIIRHEDFKRKAKVGEIFQIDENGNISLKDKTLKQIINEPNLYERKIDTTDFYQDYTYADLSNNGEVIYKILKKAKEQGYKGVVLNKVSEKGIDTPQYVVFNTSTILQNTQTIPQQKQEALNIYTDYIARVSLGIIKNPSSGGYNYTSKVKDIVYHGSREAQQILLNGFKIKQTKYKDSITNRPIWFGTEKEFSENSYSYNNTLLFNIINTIKIFNPKTISEQEKKDFVNKVVEKTGEKESNVIYDFFEIEPVWHFYTPEIINILKELGYDSFTEYEGWREDILKRYENIAVFEPEQIHVLGSKQDIEGFKAFVESNNTKTNNSESTENTLTNNTNSIAKLNGINSQKLYDIQDFLDGLDPNLTRETVLEDWIEGDYLIFPEKKLIEAYTNTQFDEFKRKIEFQHKEDSKPIENTQDNKTFIFEKIVNSLKENGLSEKTIVLSNNEYNKRQLALFGRQVSSAGFTYNGIIYLNKDKMSPKTLIHENVHLWYAFMLSKNPRAINSAKKIIKDTQWYIDVKNEYKDVYTKESDFVEEAIVRMLSDNLYEKISSGEKIPLEHLSIWKRIWDSIIDFINSITNKEYTLEDIQTIAYKDVFGKKAFQKLYNITDEDVKYAISNDYFDVVLKPSVMNNLNDTAIKNIIKDIRKTSQEIPDSFLTYNQAILNSLIGRRKRIDKFSENVIKDKDKIIEIIDKEIEFYYDNIIKLQDLGGNITWLSVINSEVEHLESTVNEISNKDIDYGQFLFRLNEIDKMFEDDKDYSITELAEARTKVKKLKKELKNIMQNAVETDIVNQRFERAGKPLNDQEKEELGASVSNAVTQMFSDENDMAMLHLFLGIKSGLKKTNQELGEYLINEVNENKQTYLASTSKLISELKMLENALTSKDKLKRLFYTWDESGIIHKEQCLISPYKMVIEAKLEELSKLKSIILTTNNPHDIVENTKRYHAIVKKYFSIVVNAENLEDHRDYIIENFGDVEYETIKKKVEELYYEFNFSNSVDPEHQVELKYEIFDEPVIKGYEKESLYNFEFLIPKPEYINEQFQEIIADPELYPIWERLNELLLSYQNPTISLYNKNYNKLGDNSGTTRRRIPIIASILETQIEQFNQSPKYWRYIGDFFKRYVFCLTTPKEQAAIRKRLKHNIQTSSFNDNYFSKFIKLKKKYSYYSYQELLKLGREAGVISSEYSENESDYEYILDAVVKAEIASTSKYNIVDIVEAINLPLAEVFAGNMVKHRMKFIIELFKDNHNKYRALKNWYNLSILGETGVDSWQTKKLPIVGTFHSRAFKEWKNNQKELVDRGEYESLELENYYFDSDNMKDKPTYHSFKLSKDANKYYTVATSTGYEYYHGEVKIEEYEYNKAFKSLLDNDIIDDEAVYITFASLVNQILLTKVVKDLALSIPAMLNNRRAGRLSNEQTAAFGRWYNMEELLDARSFLYGSMASQSISNFATLGDIYKFKFFPQKKRENLRLFEKIIKYNNLIMQKNLYETDEGLNPNSFLLNFAIDIPEFLNQGEVLLAMLSRLEYDKRDENGNIIKGEKVKFFNGKTKEFELFDLKSNALQLKKGYESLADEILYRKEGKFRDTLIDFRYVNQMNQGNYSTDDRPYLFSQPLGRLLLNYMRWVPETVNRMYKGIRTPEEIKGRINVLTGEKEKIGIMTNLAKRPLMNITFHGLASLVSTGGIGSVLLGLGMGPAGVIGVIALGSFAKAIITNKMVNGSWLLVAQNALEEEQTSIKRQINQTAAFLGNTLIRLMAELLPGQTPIVNKLRTKITDKANIQLGWDDLLLGASHEKAASLRADMMQAREASLILASEMKKFIVVIFLSRLGVTLISALLGDGGDDDDDNKSKKSKKKGITKTLEEIELKERKTAIARGISNKLINLYTQGFDSNQFAVSFGSILNLFTPTSNPSIRNMSMTYSNTVNYIKMFNGKLAYTPARMEKALIYGNIAIPFPSKITHAIIDMMYLMEDNNYTLEDRTINLVLEKRTIFTDTRVYGQGQVPLLQLLDNNNKNKHYQEKWDVLFGENKDEMFKLYMKSKYGDGVKKLVFEKIYEEQKTFDRKYSDAKNAIRDQYITDEFKSGVDYIEMFNSYEDIIKKHIKEKNYKWFMTTTGKKKINVKEED